MATKRRRVANKKEEPKEETGIDLEFVLPPDMPLLYIDNVNVLNTQTEFIVSFLQSQPPLLKSDEEWKNLHAIRSRCMARIVLNPLKMQLMVRALTANLERYVEQYIKPAQETESAGANNKNAKTKRSPNSA